jgi:hypothetical protein
MHAPIAFSSVTLVDGGDALRAAGAAKGAEPSDISRLPPVTGHTGD